MRLPYILSALLLATSICSASSSNYVYRLVVDNKALRSIHETHVYKIPKGTTEFILDFSKVLASPSFKPAPPATDAGITSAIISLPENRMYDAHVEKGTNSVHLGPGTLRDIVDHKSFKSFGDTPFNIDLGKLTKRDKNGTLAIHLESYWSCRIVMENAPTKKSTLSSEGAP
jgi:hypothetical protein